MNTGALKTTIWYKCLVCHTFFQSPKAFVIHRMKSQCRFQYKEIHKERSKWPFETPLLDNLDQEEASPLKDSQELVKSPKPIEKATELTDNCSDEAKASVPELSEKSRNLDLNQVTGCNIDLPSPLPKNQITNFEDLKNHTREESDEHKSGSFKNFDNCRKDGMTSDEVKLQNIPTLGFVCNFCQKSYSSESSLNLHISNVHEKLKPYSCKQCPKSFSQFGNLRSHVSSVHEKLRLNFCKQCPKTFSKKQNLNTHISAIHQGLKPYSCKQCPKSFSQLGSLNLHISNVHKKLKPYSCKDCSKTFGTKQCLERHFSAIHRSVKPYSCKQCTQTFGRLGTLQIHVSIVHKNSD